MLTYLYGFVDAAAPAPPDTLTGVNGGRVEIFETAGLRAVVGDVPASLYAAGRIDERLGDLTWVGEQGIAHERVVAWFVDHATILPAPLLTLYSSRAALAASAAERSPELRARLRDLDGVREWDLKVTWDPERATDAAAALSPEVRALDERIAAATPGAAYLLERKRAELARDTVAAACRERAARLLDELRPLGREIERLPLPKTAADAPVLLYAALLVPRAGEPALVDAVEARRDALRALGMDARIAGPWAPYRFVGGDREHVRG